MRVFMALKKKVVPSKINFVFTKEEQQKIVSFLALLNEINSRENKSKGKGQEVKYKDSYLIVRLFLLVTTLYLNNQYWINIKFLKTYGRYNSSLFKPRYVPY